MKMQGDQQTKLVIPADIDVMAARAFHARGNNVTAHRAVKLFGTFPASGALKFKGCFGFDMAVTRIDCEFFMDGKPQRFAGEMMVNKATAAWAWWPRWGWAPILVSAIFGVQLQGRPGAPWVIEATCVNRTPQNDKEIASEAAGTRVTQPKGDFDAVDCAPFIEEVPLEGRL